MEPDEEREVVVAATEVTVEALEVMHWVMDTWGLGRLYVFYDVLEGAYYADA